MKPIYLRFPDEKLALESVRPYAPSRPDGTICEGEDFNGYSVSLLGYLQDKVGYHVNMLVPDSDTELLKEYQVFPAEPNSIFGGFSPKELTVVITDKEIQNG